MTSRNLIRPGQGPLPGSLPRKGLRTTEMQTVANSHPMKPATHTARYSCRVISHGRLPPGRIGWKPRRRGSVDRRVVADTAQITGLLACVRGHSDRGEHLVAFYGCLYTPTCAPPKPSC